MADRIKRTPVRGNSDAAPAAAKAKCSPHTEENEHELMEEEQLEEEKSEMQQLLCMVKDIKGQTRKLDTLEDSIKDLRGELNGRLDEFEARLKALEESKKLTDAKSGEKM